MAHPTDQQASLRRDGWHCLAAQHPGVLAVSLPHPHNERCVATPAVAPALQTAARVHGWRVLWLGSRRVAVWVRRYLLASLLATLAALFHTSGS